MEQLIEQLQNLSAKDGIHITKRCNWSIKFSLKYLKSIGKTKVFIQDEGGWMTYQQYPQKEGLELIEMPTNHGLVNFEYLEDNLDNTSILLLNSLSGYYAAQSMAKIADLCKRRKSILINDVSGSIGTEIAKFGDIIVGSFGDGKPINLGFGGFIATNSVKFSKYVKAENTFKFESVDIQKLSNIIKLLPLRLKNLSDKAHKIKHDLQNYEILHKDHPGINVVIKYIKDKDKESIIDYCTKNNLEYTLCPRYIRTKEQAISIEVKRL